MRIALVAVVALLLAAAVGSAAGAVAAAPRAAPAAAPFDWVPANGFANAFPFGQCTWWAAHNHPVTWSGNAADWLANARAQGVPTSGAPSVGAVAVYRPGGPYSVYGHVALVTAVAAGSYRVSEMNAAAGWGRVSTREVPWPDPHVAGFIPRVTRAGLTRWVVRQDQSSDSHRRAAIAALSQFRMRIATSEVRPSA